jgi:uncharacterized membrane protein YqjE
MKFTMAVLFSALAFVALFIFVIIPLMDSWNARADVKAFCTVSIVLFLAFMMGHFGHKKSGNWK